MQWFPYNRTGAPLDGIPDPYPNRTDPDPLAIGMKIPFNIVVKLPGGQIILQSNGKIPNYNLETNEIENYQPFNQDIFDSFQITVDQLEGEINLPYVFKREAIFTPETTITVFGNEVTIPAQTNAFQSIEVPRSPLGGFAQFRINYQYVDFTNQEVYTGEVITPRILVPRFVTPPPPPPPPVFTIDEGQIKEALADKIYEKFFNSNDQIIGNINVTDLKTFQTTTSDDGIGYKTGRESDDDQLIFFKKDRNTPQNAVDFYNDESTDNPINRIATDISASFAGTDANGVIDLSQKLDDELSITRLTDVEERKPSSDLDPPLFVEGTETALYYIATINYYLTYTSGFSGEIIAAPFATLNRFYNDATSEIRYVENGQPKPDEWINKLNLGQLTKPKISTKVDSNKAKNILDTNIFELLPNQSTRQGQINDLFTSFYDLIGTVPTFQDTDQDGAEEKLISDSSPRISSDPDNQSAYITRTDQEADEVNDGKTLQSMRDTLNDYLGDVDNVIEEFPDLPEYKNKSEGFLKLRKYNQAIIIRDASKQLKIEDDVTVNVDGIDYTGPSWSVDGLTVTMWVRFLNSTTGGSLMTYGNPMMKKLPGFRLDTHTRSDYNSENGETTNRRMVRFVVWENTFSDGKIYDSHVGVPFSNESMEFNNEPGIQEEEFRGAKYQTWQDGGQPAYEEFSAMEDGSWHVFMQHEQIPTDDLNEWFFICATYDPTIDEEGSFDNIQIPDYLRKRQFWLNHIDPNPVPVYMDVPPYSPTGEVEFNTVSNSGFGNKCKVEVISRSDLLRARGYKV
tara:strand:- start:2462 stop:4846 length:2385 start_codon:yes stop_codon:yes gene_type:complete